MYLFFITVPPAASTLALSSASSNRCMRCILTALPPLLNTHMLSPTLATVSTLRLPSYTAITPVDPDQSSSSIKWSHTCVVMCVIICYVMLCCVLLCCVVLCCVVLYCVVLCLDVVSKSCCAIQDVVI